MNEQMIKDEMKCAMKEGNKVKVSVLRMLVSELNNKKIADGVKELKDVEVIGVIQKHAKQHRESIEKFTLGGRDDLVAQETKELEAIEGYLPEPISVEELTRIVADSIATTGASSMKDMGAVMKSVQETVGGRADGKIISQMVRERLT
jgi:uncharacterized protein